MQMGDAGEPGAQGGKRCLLSRTRGYSGRASSTEPVMSARSISSVAHTGLIACLPFLIAVTGACSDDKDASGGSGSGGASSGGASTSGGATPMGGASPSSGGASTGGSVGSGGATNGGMTAKGGASSGGASVDPGSPCTANCPTGKVHACFEHCPLGACDDSGFFASTPCSTVYPSALDAQSVYCSKGQTATYCLAALDKSLYYYQVSCNAGTPTVTKCMGGCGVSGEDKAAACN